LRTGGGRSLLHEEFDDLEQRRRQLGPLVLTATNCPYRKHDTTNSNCETKPVLVPASGTTFNHAGAVELMLARMGAEVRYTVCWEDDSEDPTEAAASRCSDTPEHGSPDGIDQNDAGGLVELRVDPPCPGNRFRDVANLTQPTYCTFKPRRRKVTVKARTISRTAAARRAQSDDDDGSGGSCDCEPACAAGAGGTADQLACCGLCEEDSAVTEGTYYVWTGRHGRAYLVPYYHGEANEQSADQRSVMSSSGSPMSAGFRRETGLGYSGKLVEVQLNTVPFKTVHLHDVITDFAEYTQFFDKVPKSGVYGDGLTESDVVGLDIQDSASSDNQFMDGSFSTGAETAHEFVVTAHGVAEKPVTSTWSHSLGVVPYEGQLNILDLAEAAANGAWGLSDSSGTKPQGFWSGFEATTSGGVHFGFLVPFFDGSRYSGLVVRVDLDSFHASSTEAEKQSSVSVLDLTESDPRARGFARGFSHGDFAYFVPLFDGVRAGSMVARVNAGSFDSASVELLDLAEPEASAEPNSGDDDDPNLASEVPRKNLAGFQGGQAYVSPTSGLAYGLLVPYRSSLSPLHGVNSKLTSDGFNGKDVMQEAEAFGGGHQAAHFSSVVVRFRLDTAVGEFGVQAAAGLVETLDLGAVDPDLRGFSDGVVVGKHLYLVPYRQRDSLDSEDLFGFFGKVVRIDLERFGQGFRAVRSLDLTQLDRSLVGFSSGFFWGKTLLLVPHRNAQSRAGCVGAGGSPARYSAQAREAAGCNSLGRAHHGKLVGIDLTRDFGVDLSAVQVLDLATVTRQQIPKLPDPELRGFSGGFAAGDYAYLVPYSNGVFFGKLVRVDMRDFSELARKQKVRRLEREAYTLDTGSTIYPDRLRLDDGTDDGSRTGTNSLGHDGVQVLDVQWKDKQLCGFSGGFSASGS